MTKPSPTLGSRLVTCCWVAGIALIVVMAAAMFTHQCREKPFGFAAGPIEFSVDEEEISFVLVFEGDGAWFRKHLTRQAWHNEFKIRVADRWSAGPGLEVRATHGTTVNGRQLRLISPTWWLVVLCFLPWMWRRARHARAVRRALRAGLCRNCGYDLRGSEGLCPECGSARDQMPTSGAVIDTRMWRRRPIFTAMALVCVVMAMFVVAVTTAAALDPGEDPEFAFGGHWVLLASEGRWTLDNGTYRGRWHADTVLGVGFQVSGWGGLHTLTTAHYTFTLHMINLLAITLFLPIWWWRVLRRDQLMIAARSCRWCWYDMEGATGPCPRCGKVR